MDGVSSLELAGAQARLIVTGELDAAASVDLRRELEAAIRAGGRSFRIDASGVTFVDTTALRALVWLRTTVQDRGGEFAIVAASDNLRWSAAVTRLEGELGLHDG